jgi:hypothetical protein
MRLICRMLYIKYVGKSLISLFDFTGHFLFNTPFSFCPSVNDKVCVCVCVCVFWFAVKAGRN